MNTRSQIFVLNTAQLELSYDANITVVGDELEDALYDALDEQRRFGQRSFADTVNYELLLLRNSSDTDRPTTPQLLNAIVRHCVSRNLPLPTAYTAITSKLATAVMEAA
jgi:hypothetical protein